MQLARMLVVLSLWPAVGQGGVDAPLPADVRAV